MGPLQLTREVARLRLAFDAHNRFEEQLLRPVLLATDSFGAGETGFSVLVAASGVGIIAGSLLVSRGGPAASMKRMFVISIALQGAAFAAAGVTPAFFLAATAFLLAGFANGIEIASSRVLIQTSVPDELLGRVFGVDNALVSAAFATAFVAGGALVAAFGPRALITGAGVATLGVFVLALWSLRRAWPETAPAAPQATPAPAPAG
jgi:MFS family permease